MKTIKKFLLVLLCLLMVQTPVSPVKMTETVQAATRKDGLYKSSKGYYYYSVNGAWVKNAWKNVVVKINGKNTTKKMYFRANGSAFMAGAREGITVQYVGTYRYGFDENGYLLTGLHVGKDTERFYYFDNYGRYNGTVTNKFRNAGKEYASTTTLHALLKQYNIKYTKWQRTNSCFPGYNGAYLGGYDYTYFFPNFYLCTVRTKAARYERFMYVANINVGI